MGDIDRSIISSTNKKNPTIKKYTQRAKEVSEIFKIRALNYEQAKKNVSIYRLQRGVSKTRVENTSQAKT